MRAEVPRSWGGISASALRPLSASHSLKRPPTFAFIEEKPQARWTAAKIMSLSRSTEAVALRESILERLASMAPKLLVRAFINASF